VAASKGWLPDSKHSMKIFHCDRNTNGSNFTMKTSIYFEQKKGLFFDELANPDGSTSYDVKKRSGTAGTCAGIESGGDDETVIAPNLIYVLTGGNLAPEGDTLGIATYYGGINITSRSQFSVDRTKMSGLAPGVYTFTAYDADQPTLFVTIKIRVQGSLSVINSAAVTTLAGRPVPIIVGKALLENGNVVLDTGVTPFSLSSQAGLSIFLDEAMQQPYAGSAETNHDGLDTLWVTSPRNVLDDKVYQVNVFAGLGTGKAVTFMAPNLALQEPDAWVYSFVPHSIHAVLTWDSAGIILPCTDCVGDLLTFEGANLVFQDANRNVATSVLVGAGGLADFFVLSESDSGATGLSMAVRALLDADNTPYAEVLKSGINLARPPVPVVTQAAMFDDDGDGIPDLLRIVFGEDVSDSLPEAFSYWFPDTASSVSVSAAELPSKMTVGARTFVFTGDFVDSILTNGTGQVDWSYSFDGGQLDLVKSIVDSVGPVILSAEINVEDADIDVVGINFSEPMNVDVVASTANWFNFRKQGTDSFFNYRKRPFTRGGKHLDIHFYRSALETEKPVAGDSVRIYGEPGLEGLLVDSTGRQASETSRLVRILGKKRVTIGSQDFWVVDMDAHLDSLAERMGGLDNVPTADVIAVGKDATPEELANIYGAQGFLVPFDLLSNFATIGDSNGVPIYADPAELALVLQLGVYTNLGGHVVTWNETIPCDDPELFGGNCITMAARGTDVNGNPPPSLYVRWNYLSQDHRLVGTGPYVAKLAAHVALEGKTVSGSTSEKSRMWGVRRVNGTVSVR
jgi:hypothetical protein